ncbi:ATP-binding cassette domain-containing protein [Ancylobacter sp.]|uniref:ATP-binding cassette domain-containing protein n=1 Tax=Ancylobacter sp. TaxID=1872567 RepID=UPI003D119630
MAPTAEPLFELSGAGFRVEGRVLLHPLDLAVPAGRVVGLIGHNGSGKSTLLKLIGRQLAASEGDIRFEGRPLGGWSARAFARRVAYLPQTAPATGGMTGRELIALGRYPWHGALGRFSAQDRQKVEEAIALTDTAGFADRLVDTLSGGERQRVWIAMLVAQDASCLLLDEPTSALDIAHQIEVLSLVRTLCRERGTGVVVVLHDVNMAARFCDDIIALHGGRLLARGTPAQMVTPDTLARIYGIAMDVIRQDGGGYVAVPRA